MLWNVLKTHLDPKSLISTVEEYVMWSERSPTCNQTFWLIIAYISVSKSFSLFLLLPFAYFLPYLYFLFHSALENYCTVIGYLVLYILSVIILSPGYLPP